MDQAQFEGVNRFGLEPRPPSPPPAFLLLPWWQRWPIAYAVTGVLYTGWALAVVGVSHRAEVAWLAVPYLVTPMLVLVVLRLRSGHDAENAETPRAFGWGAILSLASLVLFTFGYLGWCFMVVTTPAALSFLLYALTEPADRHRGRTALTCLGVVLLGFVIALADLSRLAAATGWIALCAGIAHLVWLRGRAGASPHGTPAGGSVGGNHGQTVATDLGSPSASRTGRGPGQTGNPV